MEHPDGQEFALASIKPSNRNCCVTFGVGNGGGGGKDVTLKTLITVAYRVQEFQVSGGPGWTAAERTDVEGKAEDPNASFDQLPADVAVLVNGPVQTEASSIKTRISSLCPRCGEKADPRVSCHSISNLQT